MINVYDYYNLKLNILNLDKENIKQKELKEILKNISNSPTLIQKWDIIFYIQNILSSVLTGVPDSTEKISFIDYLLNILFHITDFNYETNEKILFNQYAQIILKYYLSSTQTTALKNKINNIESILNNDNFSNNDKEYVYFYIKEKLRQILIQEYNKLPQNVFYENRKKIAQHLALVKQHLNEINQMDDEIRKINFTTYETIEEEQEEEQ